PTPRCRRRERLRARAQPSRWLAAAAAGSADISFVVQKRPGGGLCQFLPALETDRVRERERENDDDEAQRDPLRNVDVDESRRVRVVEDELDADPGDDDERRVDQRWKPFDQ